MCRLAGVDLVIGQSAQLLVPGCGVWSPWRAEKALASTGGDLLDGASQLLARNPKVGRSAVLVAALFNFFVYLFIHIYICVCI